MTRNNSIELPAQTKVLATVAGFTLCLISIIYTVQLTTDLATSFQERLLMGAVGASLEICKFIFIPLGITLITLNRFYKGSSLLALGVVLLCVSMTASLGYLSSRTNQISEEAKVQSDEYKLLAQDIETVSKQIATLEESAAKDLSNPNAYVRDRARQDQERIKELRQERSTLQEQLNDIDGESMTSAGALFTGLANLLDSDPDLMKEKSYFVLSALLEICALAALSIAGIQHGKDIKEQQLSRDNEEEKTDSDTAEKEHKSDVIYLKNHSAPTAPHRTESPQHQGSVERLEDEARYRNVLKKVQCGALKPSSRALKNYGVSNDHALQYLRRMARENIIERVGRGYQLINTENNNEAGLHSAKQ